MNALHQAARRAERTVAALEASPRLFVTAAAETVRASVDRQIASDVPRRRVAGTTVGVEVKALPGNRAIIFAQGPLHLENNPTKPHTELPKSVGRSLGSRRDKASRHDAKQRLYSALFGGEGGFAGATPLRTPYGPRYRVTHPGTKGKRTWQHGVDLALPLIHHAVDIEAATLLRSLL